MLPRILPPSDVFDEIEHLIAHCDRTSTQESRPQIPPILDAAASFEDLMAESWQFFDKEQARHAAMTQALQEQVARNLAKRPLDDPLHMPTRRWTKSSDLIDVEAREISPSAHKDQTQSG